MTAGRLRPFSAVRSKPRSTTRADFAKLFLVTTWLLRDARLVDGITIVSGENEMPEHLRRRRFKTAVPFLSKTDL